MRNIRDLVKVNVAPDFNIEDLNYYANLLADKINCALIPTSHKLDEYGVPLYSKDEIINYIKIMNTEDLLELKRKVDKELVTREIKLL